MISKNQIKYLKQLQQKRCRDSEGLYVIEGIKLVNEALRQHSSHIKQIICTSEALPNIETPEEIPVELTNTETIKRISSLKTPQPAMAVMYIPVFETACKISDDEIVIALDRLKDPGNLGTIIRLADWFGVTQIFCTKDSVDCYNPKVVQASMGGIFRVKVHYCDLEYFLAQRNWGSVYGTLLSGKNIYHTDLRLPAILLMGNESEGISQKLLKFVTQRIHIPNFSNKMTRTESLNVSTATSIAISELRRKQYYSK